MRYFSLAILFVAACSQAAPNATADPGSRDPALVALMDRIEAAYVKPAGAYEYADYARYYSWEDEAHTKVRAVYTSLDDPGSRKWVEPGKLPMVLDGGCGVVHLVYDVAKGRFAELLCGGGA